MLMRIKTFASMLTSTEKPSMGNVSLNAGIWMNTNFAVE